jgi:hypothetical protein
MDGPMPSNATKLRVGAKGALAIARQPILQRFVARIVIRRKARGQIERLVDVGTTAAAIVVIYGPMAAEVLGLVEPPKPKRRAPAFAALIVIGAGAVYVLNRSRRD